MGRLRQIARRATHLKHQAARSDAAKSDMRAIDAGRSVDEQVQGSGLDTSLRRNVMPRTLQVADIAGM